MNSTNRFRYVVTQDALHALVEASASGAGEADKLAGTAATPAADRSTDGSVPQPQHIMPASTGKPMEVAPYEYV